MSATQALVFTCPHCKSQVDVMPREGHELVTCPVCSKPFQITVPEGKPTAEASDSNGRPRATSAEERHEAEEERGPIAEKTDEKEDFIRTVYLNMFRRYPLRCLAYLSMIIGGLVLAFIFFTESSPILGGVMLALALFGVFRLVMWWLRMRNTKLTITTRRCIIESGLFTTDAIELPMKDIASISVGQNVLTRLLNIGDLTFTTSGAGRKSLIVMAVPDPGEVVGLIRGQGMGSESVPH